MTPFQSRTIRRFKVLIVVAYIGASLRPTPNAQVSQPTLTHTPPLWSAGLKHVGYNVLPFNDSGFKVGADTIKIEFLDAQRLALAWLTPDEEAGGAVTPVANVACHLRLSIIDAKTGQKLSSHNWLTACLRANLAYTATGQWLVYSDKSLTLYSSSFDKVRALENVRALEGDSFLSASRRTLLLSISDSSHAWQMRDSATFEIIDSWDDPRAHMAYLAYSDHFVLARTLDPRQLIMREIRKNWIPFSPRFDEGRTEQPHIYEYLNDHTLVTLFREELVVQEADGTELFRQGVPERGLFFFSRPTLATSADGDRFGVVLDRLRGLSNPSLDLYPFPADERVVVYGVLRRGAIFSVKLNGSTPWFPREVWNRISLSPDGLLLGIVSDEGVRVYALPSSQSGRN
jgi:hypothetical protein